ncbi:hypothetical protein C1646_698858 [Rhizophagus diaphanus]|nr:hypothetical protein C1646_698858 [Rhizophagus diaphanus] [Rhizophagus sp. MUCL 43196]
MSLDIPIITCSFIDFIDLVYIIKYYFSSKTILNNVNHSTCDSIYRWRLFGKRKIQTIYNFFYLVVFYRPGSALGALSLLVFIFKAKVLSFPLVAIWLLVLELFLTFF